MKPLYWPLLALLFSAGCEENNVSMIIVHNTEVDRMTMCVAVAMDTGVTTSTGILDVGLVADGYEGYDLYPLVKSNLLDKSSMSVPQRSDITLEGADVEILVQGGSNLAAALPSTQSSYFAPAFGGAILPGGGEATMSFHAIPRQVALQLANAVPNSIGMMDYPTVLVHFRVHGTHASDTGNTDLASGWADFPVQLCKYCLTGGKPQVCPSPPFKPTQVNLGACNVSQDTPVTCCYGATNQLLCGPFVPVAAM